MFINACTPVETETEAANDAAAAAARPAADTAAALPADKRTRLVLDSPSDAAGAARRLLRRLLPVEFIGYVISCGRAAALS